MSFAQQQAPPQQQQAPDPSAAAAVAILEAIPALAQSAQGSPSADEAKGYAQAVFFLAQSFAQIHAAETSTPPGPQ